MTYYIAKSNQDFMLPYICISADRHYGWFRTIDDVTPLKLPYKDSEYNSLSIDGWLANLHHNNLALVTTFSTETNPEFFI